ncbi:hypothetical protein [Pantanalinema sp. GBBB05]|uniref:hypothetical protein n=1 Tax=Pantanalinema sp. GBBB05 TaxID=2604139 RepID=UPI001DBC729F|nr:hypothetical protein [Pantanalinema sp. GBBB05]
MIICQISALRRRLHQISLWLGVLVAFCLNGWVLPAVAANNWQMIAQSTDHQQVQYVDLDSIAQTGPIVRLQTYWMDQQQPESKTYALAEYHCDRQQFRDLALNGKQHQGNWQTIQADPLNAAVMDYVCGHN